MPEPDWPDDFVHAGPQYRLRSAAISRAVAAERERCAKICDEGAAKNKGKVAAVLMATADLIRNPVDL